MTRATPLAAWRSNAKPHEVNSSLPIFLARRVENLLHLRKMIVRNRDREVVLGDPPRVILANKNAAAAAQSQIRRIEQLVEPCHLAVGVQRNDAFLGREASGLSLGEIRMRIRL